MAGEESQAGVRSPEWSRAGAGSVVRGRKGHLEVPAPLGRAWGLPRSPALGPWDQRGHVGWYPDPVLCVQERVLTHDEALSVTEMASCPPLPCSPGGLASGESTGGRGGRLWGKPRLRGLGLVVPTPGLLVAAGPMFLP